MAYAVQADLMSRITGKQLTELTDDTNSGAINPAIVQADLDEASGLIEGYCRNRYQTPLQPSQELTRICRDITVYLLFSRRPQKTTEIVRERYEDALKLLRDISTGKVQLDQPASAASPQTPLGAAVTPTCERLRFTDRDLEGYV